MRVTSGMVFEQARASAEKARGRHQEAVSKATSGMRVSHPGDDPVAAGLLAKHKMAQMRHEAIGQSLQRAESEIQAADGAMGELGNIFSRSRELAVQLANATYNSTDRANGATEVDELLKQAISILNTEVGGRYVFGGRKDNAPPFDSLGNYVGDTEKRKVEIAPGVLSDASIRADVAVKGVGGGVDALKALSDLATALRANDVSGITGALTGLSSSVEQVSSARTQLGTQAHVMQTAIGTTRVARDAEMDAFAREGEIDMVEAFTELSRAEKGLEASLSAIAKSFSLSLADKL